MGLGPTLNIGVQALEATSAALQATSNNISNANTPGYSREVPQLSENGLNDVNGVVVGGGVTLEGLQSVRDELLNLQIQQQTSQQNSANTASSLLQQLQSYFSSSTGGDLASTMSAFSSSLSQLSANSTSSSVQQAVLSAGQNLANSFNSTSNGLTSTQTNANGQVTNAVATINSLTQQIAQLNVQLSETGTTANNGGTVQDQRDQLVQQLSGLIGISVTQSNQGEVVTTGNGTPLVMGPQSFTLQTTTGTNGLQQVLDSTGKNITASIAGGQLGGALQVRDQVIPGLLSQLNTLASQFGAAFNAAQAQGFAPNGTVGQNFFSVPSNIANAAAGIAVSLSSPSLIASSSDGSAGSNGNVANLTAAITNALPSGSTPANAYANMVYQVGSAASTASSESSAIGANLLQLQNQQGSVSGVNTDEEATNLIRYQTAYEAAARIVSTIQHLNTVILNMGSGGGY